MSAVAISDFQNYQKPRPLLSSMAWALGIEVLLVLSILLWIATRPEKVGLQVVAINLDEAPAPPIPAVDKAKPTPVTPPKLKEIVKPITKPTPPTSQPTAQITKEAETPTREVTSVAAPTAFSQPQPSPPAPAATVQQQVGPSDEYKAKIQAAVQTAFYYPMAASEMGLHGRTRVGFTLRNTTATDLKIVVSSTLGIIDRAALQAVQKAAMPAPPAELRDKPIYYEIWIDFRPAN